MKNKYFNEAAKKLESKYNINIIDDILLAEQGRVILYADTSNIDDIELEIISGNLEIIGFDDNNSIKLSEFFSCFDYNNSYGKVAGKIEYFEEVRRQIYEFSIPRDVSFPIIHKNIRKWLRFNISFSPNFPQISIFTITDVTKLHTQEEETFEKTHLDSLTRLFNKYTFDYHYGFMYQTPGFHVMFMDIDNFKVINDLHGHAIGDSCLVAFANLLKKFESDYYRFYRLGGDEFVGLLIGTTEEIKRLAEQLVEYTRLIKLDHENLSFTLSMGVMKATKSDNLAKKADKLMYYVKTHGKNNFVYAVEEN